MSGPLGHRIWHSPSILAIANLLAVGLSLISAPIIARSIGVTGRGESAAVIAAATVLPALLALGVPLEIRRRALLEDPQRVARGSRKLWALAAIPAAIFAWVISSFVFTSISDSARIAAFVSLALAPLTMSWMGDTNILVARGRYGAVATLRIAQPVVYVTVLAISTISESMSVEVVLYANVAGHVLTFMVGLYLVGSTRGKDPISAKALLVGGFRYAGSSMAEAANARVDQVIALPLLGAQAAGLYSIASTIASVPSAIGQALGASYFRSIGDASPAKRHRLCKESLSAASSMGFVSGIALAVLCPIIIPLVFGEAFNDAILISVMMSIFSSMLVISFVLNLSCTVLQKGRLMMWAQIASLALRIGMLFSLVTLAQWAGGLAWTASNIAVVAILVMGLRLPISSAVPTVSGFKKATRRLRN